MNEKQQYIETLIELIETNQDKTWLSYFIELRYGSFLPGGGAGSLNDWAPTYSNEKQNVWYSNLYEILRFLFDNKLTAKQIDSFKAIKFKNNIRIIRCLFCNKSYQHPNVFESHISLDFYHKKFVTFVENNKLQKILIPEISYNNEETNNYRIWLEEQYQLCDIKIYDFVANQYFCPHCNTQHAEFEHDLYIVKNETDDLRSFCLQKQNADWDDFEK